MTYIEADAARLFLFNSEAEFLFGFIGRTQFMSRLSCLREVSEPNTVFWAQAQRILAAEEWDESEEWEVEAQSPSNETIRSESALEGNVRSANEEQHKKFLASNATGLADWEFHQYDPDFFPSIPHGHYRGKSQPKLDPYQGWVYRGSKQVRRESRKNIIALWNDQKFREFASIAIDYYLVHFPKYKGWPVPFPRRLPR
jgi:hypothetical protein